MYIILIQSLTKAARSATDNLLAVPNKLHTVRSCFPSAE